MIRFELCCLFKKEDIKYRRVTAKYLSGMDRKTQLVKISEIVLHNIETLLKALKTCNRLGINAYRITSPLFPLYTHPEAGYKLENLSCSENVLQLFQTIKNFSLQHKIRTTFHPDQFVVLSSPNEQVYQNSVNELEYHRLLAELIGADVINIHIGGAYGNKKETIERLLIKLKQKELQKILKYLTFENDDKIYTPEDILYISKETGIPFVYDIHHHRCNKDKLSEEEATYKCINTWRLRGKEPVLHISSPKEGWSSKNPKMHADYINIDDFPEFWLKLKDNITLDIEAKAKELAILKLSNDLYQKYSITNFGLRTK